MLNHSSLPLMDLGAIRKERAERVRNRRQLQVMVMAMLLLLIALNTMAPVFATFTECFLASLIIIVGASPTFIYFIKRENGIPYMPLWGVGHAIYYGLPIFTLDDYTFKGHGTEAGITASLWMALIGAILLLATFYNLPKFFTRYAPQITIHLQPLPSKLAAVGLGIIGIYVSVMGESELLGNFKAIIGFIQQWASLAVGILFVLYLKNELNFIFKIILWGILLPALLLIHLGSGFLMNPLRDLLLLMFIYWGVRRQIPYKAIFIGIVLLAPFIALKSEFRDSTWYEGEDSGATLVEKGLNYIELVNKRLLSDSKETYQSSIDTTVTRVAYLQTLVVVVEDTPDVIPYMYGDTYKNIFVTFIPRFLWPDKPEMTLGQTFGHRYLILDDSDYWTSWNLPQFVEFYVNFGWWGIIIGMPLLGAIYRLIYEVVNDAKAGDGGVVLAAMIFVGLSNLEADFSLVFGALIQTTILYIVMLRFIGQIMSRETKFKFGNFNQAAPALNK